MCAAAFAQEPPAWPSLRVAGQIGGPTIAVAVSGNLLFAGSGYQVIVYDISNPVAPREVGSSPSFSDFVRGIAVVGTHAYIAAGASGLHVIDVRDPSNPSEIGGWDSPGSSEGIAVEGAIAYLADGPFGVQLVDVSAPANPKPISNIYDDFMAFDVARSGNTLMIAAAGAGLLLADVSDPRAPREIAWLDTPGYARAVASFGTQALIADQWDGLRIVDLTDPRRPIEVGSLAMRSWAFDVAVEQSTAFVATGTAGLVAVDIADPARPRQIGSLSLTIDGGPESPPLTIGDAVGVAIADGRAFLASGRGGLRVIDITAPATPRLLAVQSRLADGAGTAADFPHVFVGESGRMTVVDVSRPAEPREIGAFELGYSSIPYLGTSAGMVYAGTSSNGRLLAIDVSDPRKPVETGRVDLVDAAFRAMAFTDTLLLAATEWDLVIFDISDRRKPVLKSRLRMQSAPFTDLAAGVAVIGRHAFVAQTQQGMTVVDFTDPSAPVIVARYRRDGVENLITIAAAGTYAYLPTCGLNVVDVSNPREPRTVTSISLPGCVYRATLDGGRLYLTLSSGVLEIDVSKPSAPVIVSRTDLPGFASEVAIAGPMIAVAVERIGLFLLEKSHVTVPATTWSSASNSQEPARIQEIPPRRVMSAPDHSGVARSAARPSAGRQISVTSTADSGTGSLRQAIESALEGDVISFDAAVFPPKAPAAIRPLTSLPCIEKPYVTIDASNAGVVIDGSALPPNTILEGLGLCSDHGLVMGLQVINFPGSGFLVSGTDNVLGGDRKQGLGPLGRGNLASGNRKKGVTIGHESATRNRVIGNVLGPAPNGLTVKYEQETGVSFLNCSDNTLGGTLPGEGNVISGNRSRGIEMKFAGHNTIVGNYIGTDETGTRIEPNQARAFQGLDLCCGAHDNAITDNVIAAGDAVAIADPDTNYNRLIRNRIGISANGERIAAPAGSLGSGIGTVEYTLIADNVIAGLSGSAIHIAASDVFILGNRIGTDPTGTLAIPNGGPSFGAITLSGARRIFIGDLSPGDGNVISGNIGAGIKLQPGTEHNFILGNSIGATVFGEPLGNSTAGILIGSSEQNFIQRNTITANSVGIDSTERSRNRIRRNSIFGNTDKGIRDDFTAPAPAAPVISEAGLDYVKGSACAGCLIEVFSDRDDEGRWFEGETVASDSGQFTMQKRGSLVRGPRVSATSTDRSGTTSVFSATVQTPPRPPRRRAVRR